MNHEVYGLDLDRLLNKNKLYVVISYVSMFMTQYILLNGEYE